MSKNQELKRFKIFNSEVLIKAVSDDDPEMELAYRLWYEVYMQDLKHEFKVGVDHIKKTLTLPVNGSIVYLAISDGKCIGTMRTTHNYNANLEFEYENWLPGKKLVELTKFVVAKEYRRSILTNQLILSPYEFCFSDWENRSFDHVVMSSTERMLNYYSVFGFKKILSEKVIHPVMCNEAYLLECDLSQSDKNVARLNRLFQSRLKRA